MALPEACYHLKYVKLLKEICVKAYFYCEFGVLGEIWELFVFPWAISLLLAAVTQEMTTATTSGFFKILQTAVMVLI